MKKISTTFALVLLFITAFAQSCPDNNHPHMIDLGLPSGTKWACCNVDASSPEEYGGYYEWGELYNKGVPVNRFKHDNYSVDSNYKRIYKNIGSDIAGTRYDVAFVLWGGNWRMPNNNQIKELCHECINNMKIITYKGIKGIKFTGPNGNSIFLPAAGSAIGDNISGDGYEGYYWSSTLDPAKMERAYSMTLYYPPYSNMQERGIAYSVRPVTYSTQSY